MPARATSLCLNHRAIRLAVWRRMPRRIGMDKYWLHSAFALAVLVGVLVFGLKLALPGW